MSTQRYESKERKVEQSYGIPLKVHETYNSLIENIQMLLSISLKTKIDLEMTIAHTDAMIVESQAAVDQVIN